MNKSDESTYNIILRFRRCFMGLTSNSTGNKVLNEDMQAIKEKAEYTIAIARQSKCGKIHYI
jgi:hypothetical protein